MALGSSGPHGPGRTRLRLGPDQFVVACGSERVCPRWVGCPKVSTITTKAMMAAAAAVNPMINAILRSRAPDVGGVSLASRLPSRCLPAYFQGWVPMGPSFSFFDIVSRSRGSNDKARKRFYRLTSLKATVRQQLPLRKRPCGKCLSDTAILTVCAQLFSFRILGTARAFDPDFRTSLHCELAGGDWIKGCSRGKCSSHRLRSLLVVPLA